MGVVDRIVEHAERLTATERRITELLAAEPQAIAFGTVAQVAGRASTSGPSVVRLAVKLGYSGFVGLQAAVQEELASQLGPAHQRRDTDEPTDLRSRAQRREMGNVAATLDAVPEATLDHVVRRVADRDRRVWVIGGEVTGPVASSLAGQLASLRDGVALIGGSPAAIGRALAGMGRGDVLVAIDVRRYEHTVVDTVRIAVRRGADVVAITDGPLSPLATPPACPLFVAASGVGPFDSMTGALALANLIASATAGRLQAVATRRFEAVEDAWGALDAIVGAPTAPPGDADPIDIERLASTDPAAVG
ncbi:MAG TPA: MurR/RpiR family transcriptional regulator [Acidimicrobiales bacterium]|nr:MurR/RpiR family transcriptional regulator [Acidimicrobiales bacterium]